MIRERTGTDERRERTPRPRCIVAEPTLAASLG